MRAVVLAAGEGKRMRPLTAHRPKVLLPVAGVPLLERLLLQLSRCGIDEATVIVHYAADAVRERIGDGSLAGLRVSCVDQGAARGTGDAVRAAKPPEDEPFLVVNGDLFLPEGAIRSVVEAGPGAVAASRVPDARDYGVLVTEGGVVRRVVEKSDSPPGNLVNAGVYHFPAGFAKRLHALAPSPRGELELTDALGAALAEHDFRAVELAEWLDVGRPWDLLAANERALASLRETRVEGIVEAGATLKGPVHVGEGSVVKAGAYVEGPVRIGRGCAIGPNCHLRPNTSVGDGAKIGNACEVKASVLFDGVHVGHLSYVGDSVIGERANLGAGTLVANLRHDGKSVKVETQGGRHDSGRRKLGVILGPDVHTGINTSLNVGVVLGPGATTRPGEVVMKSRF